MLCGISPLIWRRLLVSNETSVAELHDILPIVFGRSGEHLHRFRIHGRGGRPNSCALSRHLDHLRGRCSGSITETLRLDNKHRFRLTLGVLATFDE
ncbi:MAG: hypothetical protein JO150_13815 [Acidobacteriaceae bacterium]|nr:hypothetical protein [Acidobacteriaceae bacterium]